MFRRQRDVEAYAAFLTEDLQSGGHALHAFVFMIDHHHLVARVGAGSLSQAIHRAHTRFGAWFNSSVGRTGPVFEGRFRARRIRGDSDLIGTVAYVHRNPVRARLVRRAERWPWTGHLAYLGRPTVLPVDTAPVLGILESDAHRARQLYLRRIEQDEYETASPAPGVIASVCARLGLERSEFRSSRSPRAAAARAQVAATLRELGWRIGDIARDLGLPVRTVERLCSRGRAGPSGRVRVLRAE